MLCGERGLTADEAQFVGDAIELLTHEDMREIHSLITHRGASRATKVDVIRPTLDVDRAGPQHLRDCPDAFDHGFDVKAAQVPGPGSPVASDDPPGTLSCRS